MNISRYEQETIINYNEGEQICNVYTHNSSLMRKLKELHQERPEDVKVICAHEKNATFEIPKAWIRIYPPRKSKPMTEEQKQKLVERLNKGKVTE